MEVSLNFKYQSEVPTKRGKYILYNQCDGFHFAQAMFDESGKFSCFYTLFPETQVFSNHFYQAWALLIDTKFLYEIFGDHPTSDRSAYQVTLERLGQQAIDAKMRGEK